MPNQPTLTLVSADATNITIAYDFGSLQNVYPEWGALRVVRNSDGYLIFLEQGGYPFTVGTPGVLGQSGQRVVSHAGPGGYTVTLEQNQRKGNHGPYEQKVVETLAVTV